MSTQKEYGFSVANSGGNLSKGRQKLSYIFEADNGTTVSIYYAIDRYGHAEKVAEVLRKMADSIDHEIRLNS